MGKRAPDLCGQRFRKLLVLERVPSPKQPKYRCRCDCGNETVVRGDHLRSGCTIACGCVKAAGAHKTHGKSHIAIYGVWLGMRRRCADSNDPRYEDYGGRGIHVCDRWQSFENFLADMGERPLGCSLDRKDNDGNYEPGNCRWASGIQQARNSRKNVFIEYQGQRRCIAEWAVITGLNQPTLFKRLKSGWPIARALTPLRAPSTS